MQIHRSVRVLLIASATLLVATVGLRAGGAAAQEDGTTTTETTQLDLDDGSGDTTTTETTQLDINDGSDGTTTTETTQLDIAGQGEETTTTQFGGTAQEPPTRIDAGAGGTAWDSPIPLSGIALAGGLVIATGAAALKMRRELRA